MTIEELIDLTHQQVLNVRNLQYLVMTQEFKDIYKGLSVKERGDVITMVLKNNLFALKEWMEKKKPRPIEEYTVAELRVIVREFGVENAHLMTKVELLGIIYARRNKEVDPGNGVSGNGVVQNKDLEALDWIS